jgi:hypothetical protein
MLFTRSLFHPRGSLTPRKFIRCFASSNNYFLSLYDNAFIFNEFIAGVATHYDTLGVSKNASQDEIKKAYHVVCKMQITKHI